MAPAVTRRAPPGPAPSGLWCHAPTVRGAPHMALAPTHPTSQQRPQASSSQPRTFSFTFAGSSSQFRLCSHELCHQQMLLQHFRAKHFTMLTINGPNKPEVGTIIITAPTLHVKKEKYHKQSHCKTELELPCQKPPATSYTSNLWTLKQDQVTLDGA